MSLFELNGRESNSHLAARFTLVKRLRYSLNISGGKTHRTEVSRVLTNVQLVQNHFFLSGDCVPLYWKICRVTQSMPLQEDLLPN